MSVAASVRCRARSWSRRPRCHATRPCQQWRQAAAQRMLTVEHGSRARAAANVEFPAPGRERTVRGGCCTGRQSSAVYRRHASGGSGAERPAATVRSLLSASTAPARLASAELGGADLEYPSPIPGCCMADRPGIEGAHHAQLDGRTVPVEARFVLVQLVRVGGQAVLYLRHTSRQPAGRGFDPAWGEPRPGNQCRLPPVSSAVMVVVTLSSMGPVSRPLPSASR